MATVSLVTAGIALAVSIFSVGWQVFTWRQSRRFRVRVEIEGSRFAAIGSAKYEITVIVRNEGAVAEGVDQISLEFPVTEDEIGLTGGICVWQRKFDDPEIQPRRNLRKTFDLAGLSRYSPFPSWVVAHVLLESGETVVSLPHDTSSRLLEVAMFGTSEVPDNPPNPDVPA